MNDANRNKLVRQRRDFERVLAEATAQYRALPSYAPDPRATTQTLRKQELLRKISEAANGIRRLDIALADPDGHQTGPSQA